MYLETLVYYLLQKLSISLHNPTKFIELYYTFNRLFMYNYQVNHLKKKIENLRINWLEKAVVVKYGRLLKVDLLIATKFRRTLVDIAIRDEICCGQI